MSNVIAASWVVSGGHVSYEFSSQQPIPAAYYPEIREIVSRLEILVKKIEQLNQPGEQ